METGATRVTRPSAPMLERLLPLADRVEALTRRSGRAFVERDAELASSLLALDGEHERLDSDLDAAWSDLLHVAGHPSPRDFTAGVGLVASLQTIARLAATICDHVVRLSDHAEVGAHPAIQQLAEIVPDLLKEALGALRSTDPLTAERLVQKTLAMDTCFAQTHLDLLQVVRQDAAHMETAQRLHAVTRALERIGDGAGDIAHSVRPTRPS